MNSCILDEVAFSRLHHLYHNESTAPIPSPEHRRSIGKILANARVSPDPRTLEEHVGFDDEVVLSSLADDNDDFVFRVVMPAGADPGNDRISILTAVSLAVFGRLKGEVVAWEANGDIREMRITSIGKSTTPDMEATA